MMLDEIDPRSRRAVIDAILRNDLCAFVQAAFPIVSGGSAFVPNWHIEAITHALTRVQRGEIKRLIITVPPRSLKSICASVAFPAFVLGHDPTRRIISVCYSEGLARKHANDFRAVMKSPLFQRLFPRTRISTTKDTELEAMTTARGYRYATSVGGTLTGRGGNLLILDDPMKPQDAHSETARESLKQWYANTLMPRLDCKAEDAIIVVMQRLHVDDLVGHLLEEGGWHELNLPAIADTEQIVPVGPGRDYHRKVGELLHPEREPYSVLQELKHSMGSLDFAAQYQQEPVPAGGNLIKWSWFTPYDEPPDRQPGDKLIVSWDTAMSAGELADYSACVVLQVRGEFACVLDVVRERLDYPYLKRKVIEMHRRWRSFTTDYTLLIENKGSGMSLIQDLKREGIHAVAAKPKGDKVLRMNDRLAILTRRLTLLPPEEIVQGAGATMVMAAFLHADEQGGRFTDGRLGAWYAALDIATAIDETVHHSSRRLRLADGAFPSSIQMRELVANTDCDLVDLRGQQESHGELYEPSDYRAAQRFGTGLRWPETGTGENGIIYDSVRRVGGINVCLYRPSLIILPVIQADHYEYRWDAKGDVTVLKLTNVGTSQG